MKQVLQNLANGKTSIVEVPCPTAENGQVLIKTARTLISVGTERMLVEFGKAGWIEKARSQPDKVKEVLDKVRTDGFSATYEAIKSKLDRPLPLGYCNVGTVLNGGSTGFDTGMRVVSNGHHAEVVRVPKNLVAKIPDAVSDETASFTIPGAIAMQGIRLINPNLGETVVVTGLGLLGLLAVQILKANGCQVLGIDFDTKKCALAKQFGAEVVDLSKEEDALLAASAISRGRGVDAVLVTATSKKNDIIKQAATMCRKRGRIVLVGVVGLELNRADFYEKELTFQVSCSYGPGRYDPDYEEKGKDYPIAFVRWTEQRNFEAVLDLMASGAINVKPLVSHRFSISHALEAYRQLEDSSSLGILIEYGQSKRDDFQKRTVLINERKVPFESNGNVAFIGGGNYASRVLIPTFKKAGANFTTIVTSGGVSAVYHGKKNGFATASTEIEQAIKAPTDTVVIATQHNLHASQIIVALDRGRHVFVEKPLAINYRDIDTIETQQKLSNSLLMVGYNRRFAPHIQKIKELISKKPVPKTFIITVNAGNIHADHWTQNITLGGGRIIGEACHFIDLMRFLVGAKITSFKAAKMGKNNCADVTDDKAIITLIFEDGSLGSIHYFANGGKSFAKERIEVFCDGGILQLDNFRTLKGYDWRGFKKMDLWSQNKGQENCIKAFMKAVKHGEPNPIPLDEIFEVARVSVEISEYLRK